MFLELFREMKTFEAKSKITQRAIKHQYRYALRAQRLSQQYRNNFLQNRTRQK